MEWFIWLISVFWIAFGSLAILYTAPTRETTGRMVARLGRVPLGVLAAVFGLLLMVASRGSIQAGFIFLLGLLGLIKGGLFLWNPGGIYEKSVQWSLVTASDQTYRFMGIVSLILGTALISWS
jgi:membrane-bound ClpP family serine protease